MYTRKAALTEGVSQAYRFSKQGVSFDDKRNFAVHQRKMIQCIVGAHLKHENGCGCAGCMSQKIGASQQRSNFFRKVVQRVINYNGINYDHNNHNAFWVLLNWNVKPNPIEPYRWWMEDRGITGPEVRGLIQEVASSDTVYNLGADRESAFGWVTNVMKGRIGLIAAPANPNRLAPGGELAALNQEANAVRTLTGGGQEFQSMNFEGNRVTTGNKDGFVVPPVAGLGGRNLIHYYQPIPAVGNTVVRADEYPDHSHAEIILLEKVIRHVYTTGFPTQMISLAGRRLPCGHCQQVINRFIIANQGWIEIDYVKPQEGMVNGVLGGQVANPAHYGNALGRLSTVITPENIDDIHTGNNIQVRQAWLRRMIPVIDYTSKQV